MKHAMKIGCATILTFGIATAANANDAPRPYVSGHASYNFHDLPAGVKNTENEEWGYGALMGVEFGTGVNGITVAPEAGWQHFGELDSSTGPDTETDGYTVGLKVAAPISADGRTRLYGRAGHLWWNQDRGPIDQDGTDWYYGGGFDHMINANFRMGLDVQFQELDTAGGDTDVVSTALRGTFLF